MTRENSRLYKKALGFECRNTPDGYVIYGEDGEYIHFLNISAAIVFELCDGNHSDDDIVEYFQKSFGLKTKPSADIEACLVSLAREGLIISFP